MDGMLELEDAQSRLLDLAPLMPVESLAVEETFGRYLASNLHAARTQPPADLSAMDGYAIAGTRSWRIMGESRAGAPYDDYLCWGQCVRISTGAQVPRGADSILIQEDAELLLPDLVDAPQRPNRGQHIRRAGMDFKQGDELLAAGTCIGAPQIALAISAGHAQIEVRRAPKVAVMDSGDELAPDPSQCGQDQIPASNGAMLASMLRVQGCEVIRIGPVADDEDALAEALALADDADILVTSGGASVGDHDLIKPALENWGAQLAFWKVAIKPGKPLIVATRGSQVILGLPGNPVSSFVTAYLFLLPLVRKAMGAASPLPRPIVLPAAEIIPAGGTRREFLRAVIDYEGVRPLTLQDSSALANLARAQCLIERVAEADPVPAGSPLTIYPLGNGGIA
ncbi:molybdopterin molybdotransferase MoeA [Altererythrobacter sp. GH1-8]|uniref:molybdopterin molybdotransferase MoeA n=1 Tax=Altererythrobacter sp. GH1-8 TaxID=3349333 RepID=UPI00374DCF51